jgi:hypothetical protein
MELSEILEEKCPEALLADGFENAILGISYRCGSNPVVSYDYWKCIAILEKEHNMTIDDAIEYFEFNVVGAYVGEGTPTFVETLDFEEVYDEETKTWKRSYLLY